MNELPNTLTYAINLTCANQGCINADHLNKSERRSLILNILDDISSDKTDIELSELIVADYSLVVLLLKFITKPTDTIAAHRLSDDLVDRIFSALPRTISDIFDEAQDEYLSKYECENIEHIRADNLERYRDFKDRAVNY